MILVIFVIVEIFSVIQLWSRDVTLTGPVPEKSVKPLKVGNLFIMFSKDDKMTLSFNIDDKAKTTVRIYDDNGKKLFEDVKNNFSGKYSKEIKKMKGDMIIQISQGKKYFHKELEIEY